MKFKIRPLEIKFEGNGQNLLGKAESMDVEYEVRFSNKKEGFTVWSLNLYGEGQTYLGAFKTLEEAQKVVNEDHAKNIRHSISRYMKWVEGVE